MKAVLVLFILMWGYNAVAQFKIPSKRVIEKKVEQRLEKKADRPSTSGGNNSSENVAAGGADVAVPPEETNSPAKGQINLFWKHIEKMRSHTKADNMQVVYSSGIQNAQMALNNTRTKDANYNTSDMEKALAQCQAVYNDLGSAKNNTRNANVATINATELLFDKPFLFEKAALDVGGDNINNRAFIQDLITKSDAVIADYKNQVDAFLASNPAKAMYQNDQSAVAAKAKSSKLIIDAAAEVFKDGRSLGNVRAFQALHAYKAFLESAKKVFPQEASLAPNLASINEAIAKYGNSESFMDKMAANQKEYIKNLRMAPAVMQNPALEKVAKQKYEAGKMSSQSYVVTKVHLASAWRLERNVLGTPLHKEVFVNMAIKFADGTCGLANAWLHEDYEGGGKYGATQLYHLSSIQELPCENLK